LKENLRIVLELWKPLALLENLRFYSYYVIPPDSYRDHNSYCVIWTDVVEWQSKTFAAGIRSENIRCPATFVLAHSSKTF
jgi:hypothetical protein